MITVWTGTIVVNPRFVSLPADNMLIVQRSTRAPINMRSFSSADRLKSPDWIVLSLMSLYRCSCLRSSDSDQRTDALHLKNLPIEMEILRDKELEVQESGVDQLLRDVLYCDI